MDRRRPSLSRSLLPYRRWRDRPLASFGAVEPAGRLRLRKLAADLVKVLPVPEHMPFFDVHKQTAFLLPIFFLFHEAIAQHLGLFSVCQIVKVIQQPARHIRSDKTVVMQPEMPSAVLHPSAPVLLWLLHGFGERCQVQILFGEPAPAPHKLPSAIETFQQRQRLELGSNDHGRVLRLVHNVERVQILLRPGPCALEPPLVGRDVAISLPHLGEFSDTLDAGFLFIVARLVSRNR